MNNKIIIGIEGISYSGKTTLCQNISLTNNEIIIVNESPKFAGIKINISNDINDIQKNSETTLQIEERRTNYVKQYTNRKVFAFDMTIFSFISISYAYYNTNMINYYNEYVDKIIDGIKSGIYLVPDYLVYLRIDEKEMQSRMQKKKKNLPDYWMSNAFKTSIENIMEYIVDFYDKKKRCISPKTMQKISNEKLSKIDNNEVIELLRSMKI